MSHLVLPLTLAALAAACFAGAAVVQQSAVRTTVGADDRLSLRRLSSLLRQPPWLGGVGLAAAGVGLHAGALSMAPLSAVQPVGVLAVPLSVAMVFALTRQRPSVEVVAGAALTVAGVVGFVLLAGVSGGGRPRVGTPLLLAAVVAAAVVAALAALGLSRRGRLRAVGCAAAAATSFGLVSLLLRTLLTGLGSLPLTTVLVLLAGMAAAVGVGGWLSQQALAAGAAAASLAVLTLLDPVVAVTLGAVLGDGAPASWLWPALAALPAVVGVALLSRHPSATGAATPGATAPGAGPAGLRDPRSTGGDAPRAEPVDERPLRVLIGADTYPPDVNGAARFAGNLSTALAARGHEVHVLAPSTTGAPGVEPVDGATVHHVRSHAFPGRPGLRICLPWQVRAAARAVLEGTAPDVVHVQSHFPVSRSLLTAAHRAGVAAVATNHVVPENFLARVPARLRPVVAAWFWADLVAVLHRAEVVTAPTPLAVALLARAGLDDAIPVSNGIDLASHRPLAPADGAGARATAAPTVLFVGRLDREKHVEDLVRATALLRGREVRVEVVGDGPCRTGWQDLATSLGVGRRVRFLGHLDDADLAAARARADVFVMPGTAELQSLATLEAMACALPVVAADAMALPHLVRPGANGWLYPPGDARALADRLADVLDDPPGRARMGRESRRTAAQHDAERTLATFELLYDVARGAALWRDAARELAAPAAGASA